METVAPRSVRTKTVLAAVGILVISLALALPAGASGPAQDGQAVDISERECAFWIDVDGDQDGDDLVDAHPDRHILQETAVEGGCEFKLNTETESTLVMVSELTGWKSEVTVTQKPGMGETFHLHPADDKIHGLRGGMEIEIKHAGATPRSGKIRSLNDGYEHEVQVPRPFRLVEITVITPDGRQDRLEVSVQSASVAYLDAQRRILATSAENGAASEPVVDLAAKLMNDGYPQTAVEVLALADDANGKSGSGPWLWTTIALAVLIGAAGVAVGAFVFLSKRTPSARVEPSPLDRLQ